LEQLQVLADISASPSESAAGVGRRANADRGYSLQGNFSQPSGREWRHRSLNGAFASALDGVSDSTR
jgi:hypothetical protein